MTNNKHAVKEDKIGISAMNNSKHRLIASTSLVASMIFLIAIVARLAHIYEISRLEPYYQNLYVDAISYDQWGLEIAAGEIIGKGVFFQDPLYPYFLGLIYYIFGHNLVAVLLIQGTIGSLSSVLVYQIGKRLVNGHVGLIAGILWSLYPPVIFHEGLLMKESIAVFLATLAVYTLIVAKDSGRYTHWFLGGVALALSALTRGNMILIVPFILFWTFHECRASLFRVSVLFLLGLFTVFMPVALRNKVVGGELVITTSQAGANFYWGNNEDARGSFIPAPRFVRMNPAYEQEDFAMEAARLTGKKEMSSSEVSRFWFGRGLEFIFKSPARYAWLEYQKLRLLFNKAEISDNYEYYYLKRFSKVLEYSPVSFWMIGSLGLLGMVLSINSWKRLSLLYLFIISYSISLLVFYVHARYRLVLVPFLTVFAAVSLYWMWQKIMAKEYLSFRSPIVLLLVFIAFVGQDIKWVSTINKCEVLYQEAQEMERKGDDYSAALKYRELLGLGKSVAAHFKLGNIYYKEGKKYQAIDEYKKALEDGNSSYIALAHFNLAVILKELNQFDEAIEEFQFSLRLDPELLESYIALAQIFEKKGMAGESLRYLNELLKRDKNGEWSTLVQTNIELLNKGSDR